ncbi:MAG: DUF3352 domain-containing protein [Bacteroidota bacterium]|nr:DUF3352 domain-containing protein [Bacteroidota bacterium]
MKRVWLWIIAIMIVAGGATAYYLYSNKEKEQDLIPALKAVSPNTPLLMIINNPYQLSDGLQQNPIWQEFLKIGSFNELNRTIEVTDSLIRSNPELADQFKGTKLVMSYNYAGNNDYLPTYFIYIKNGQQKSSLQSVINSISTREGYSINERSYNNQHIFEAQNKEGRHIYSYTFLNNLFVFSPTSVFVEDAIRQAKAPSILDDPYFKKIYKNKDIDADLNVFINHRYFPRLVSFFTKNTLKRSISSFNSYACWSCLNLNIQSQRILFSGYSNTNDSLNNYLNLLLNQSPVNHTIDKALPSNTSFYISFGISNYKTYFSDLENYLRKQHKFYQRVERLKKIKTDCGVDLIDLFTKISDKEFALAFTDIEKGGTSKNQLLLFELSNTDDTKDQMADLLKEYIRRQQKKMSLKKTIRLGGNDRYDIFQMPFDDFASVVFGDLFASSSFKSYTFYDNYLVFADNSKTLESYLKSMKRNETLLSNKNYAQVKDNLDSKGNMYAYLNIAPCLLLGNQYLDDLMFKNILQKSESVRNFTAAGWRLGSQNGMIENQGIISYSGGASSNTENLWNCSLDAAPAIKPQIVNNHKNPDKKEIIVQDVLNNLYLIDNTGNIEWKINLSGRILGSIQQIDYYKSGKFQFLFNTKDQLYMIDRNGKNIEGFPARFKSPATNGVAAIDYDKNRDYRYFVATEDLKIKVFQSNGKPLEGWSFNGTSSQVTQPIQYARIGSNDYIVFADRKKVYILDRKGKERVNTPWNQDISANNPVGLDLCSTPNNSRILYTNSKGEIHYIAFNGQTGIINAGDYSSKHWFTCGDFNADGKVEMIIIDGKDMKVLDNKGSKLFKHDFDENISNAASVFTIDKTGYIGVYSNDEGKVYLFDRRGSMTKGFPLNGSNGIDVGKMNNRNSIYMITGNGSGGLILYRIAN